MTWPTSVVIDTIFIPLYLILAALNLLNVIKHGHGRTVGFISLLLFSLLHLVGNILLVVEYKEKYSSIEVTVWGYILQSIGLSFLVSACLAFYSRARASVESQEEAKGTGRRVKLLNLVNIGALVCIITGYTSTSFTNKEGQMINPNLPTQTKVGAVLYVLLILLLVVLAAFHLRGVEEEKKVIRRIMLVATPMMLVRAGYAVYTTTSGSVLMPKNIWVKLVLQYVVEFGAVCVLTSLGFLVGKAEQREGDVESVGSQTPLKDGQQVWVAGGCAQQGQMAQVGMSYHPPARG